MTQRLDPISAGPSAAADLIDRVAIVTGAGRGLGQAIAVTLARAGARLVLVDLAPCVETANRIAEFGGSSSSYEADVSVVADASRVASSVRDELGRIDVLVNNAGRGGRVSLTDLSEDDFLSQTAVNLKAAIFWTQAVAPIMAEQGGGKIVTISSISARMGGVTSHRPGAGGARSGPVYAATKGGLLAFTRWAAKDLASAGILVNAVCPGPMATDATSGFEYDFEGAPIQRVGDPLDVGMAVLFLASQMSNHITGQTLNVDGGLRMD